MTVFGYDKTEDPQFAARDVQPSFLKALSDYTTVPENQIEISTEDYNCQTACTSSAGSPKVGVIVKVVITAKGATEQAAVEQAVEDLKSADETHDGEECCKPEFEALFNDALTENGLSRPASYSLSSVGTPEYVPSQEKTSEANPTPAPGADGGGGLGMIVGVVVAVVVVAAAGVLVYKQKTKKAVVSRVEKKPKGGMVDNPMSLGDVYGNAGDPNGVLG
jgi:hypothetical protein